MENTYEIKKYFYNFNLNKEQKKYLDFHAKRYAYLLNILKEKRSLFKKDKIKIMDVGPSFFTDIIRRNFPQDQLYLLGFDNPKSRGGHFPIETEYNKNSFFIFDLNNSQHTNKWIKIPKCDIIIMAEVIEHLYTSPLHILNFIKSFLKNNGYFIIQTPNAISLIKRIKLMLGRNPYEMIRENTENPGHFREYTKNELFDMARKIGFVVENHECKNYFNYDSFTGKFYVSILNLLPKSLRDGITITLRKA